MCVQSRLSVVRLNLVILALSLNQRNIPLELHGITLNFLSPWGQYFYLLSPQARLKSCTSQEPNSVNVNCSLRLSSPIMASEERERASESQPVSLTPPFQLMALARRLATPPNKQSATQPLLVSSRNAPPHLGALRDDTNNGCVADYQIRSLITRTLEKCSF